MFDFSDRVVVVTGATGNLGVAAAESFHASGGNLVVLGRDEDRLKSTFEDIDTSSDRFLPLSVDMNDTHSVEGMVSETIDHFGRIDVLVNAAGGFRGGTPIHETPIDEWDFMLNLNARTVFIVCRAVVPTMLEQGNGKIVNVGSRSGLNGGAKGAAYSASKSAVLRLTESMAAELKNEGINVNCVLPSTIDTPQNRRDMPDADHDRWPKPEEIADVILFLASDAARVVHGAALPVYGRS